MICKHCKKEFKRKLYRRDGRKNPGNGVDTQKYCSKKCGIAASTKRRKPLSHVVIYRAIIVDYLGNRCAKCGTTENLNIHHIKPRYLGGEDKMENIILLCKTHHEELHKNY